jgi:hypothetical protein
MSKQLDVFAGIDVTTRASPSTEASPLLSFLVLGIGWHYHQRVNNINEGSKGSNDKDALKYRTAQIKWWGE